jgi:hypothetical protein
MRVGINPQFFRQWYDRQVRPVFLFYSGTYGDSGTGELSPEYVVPDGRFALFLSATVWAWRIDLRGRISKCEFSLEVALRENPYAFRFVWGRVLEVGCRASACDSVIGHLGFLREGDRVRWWIYGLDQEGLVMFAANAWLAEFIYQG